MRFDWYQGTIKDDVKSVIASLAGSNHVVRQDCDSTAKQYFYENGFTISNPETSEYFRIFGGGKNGKTGTHFIATSDTAEAVCNAVRSTWPEDHHVTRADACQDLHGSKLFKTVVKSSRKIAAKYKLSSQYIHDPINELAGATQYLGSPSSDYRGRAYQKALEVRAKAIKTIKRDSPNIDAEAFLESFRYIMPDGSAVDPRDVVRIEAQIRPRTSEGKHVLATATPDQCFGFSPWLQDWGRILLSLSAEKLDIRGKKISDFDHKCEWMVKQYHPVLTEIIDSYGVDGTGAFIQHLLAKYHQK